jgi:phage baseplate assembly protein W
VSTAVKRLDQITAADWSLRLGELGAVVEGADDVAQCVRVILGTPRGSVPLAPEFGCDAWAYLDRPMNEARPRIIREVIDAIERWEPRAELVSVAAELDTAEAASLRIVVTFRVRGTAGSERLASVEITR